MLRSTLRRRGRRRRGTRRGLAPGDFLHGHAEDDGAERDRVVLGEGLGMRVRSGSTSVRRSSV
jgi:hypothetical protein